jgi:hypothetical protein
MRLAIATSVLLALACLLLWRAGLSPRGASAPLIPFVRAGGANGWTPLMHAVHKNQIAAARALLDGGAPVDTRNRSGETALMMAAGYGYTPMVELLLAHGANPRAATPDGYNVLAAALGGVPDIDRFTLGSCQAATVQALKRKDPSLRLPDNLWARVAQFSAGVAKLRGCPY